ncbi:chromatin binding protein [Savitreella phatthalungensis]
MNNLLADPFQQDYLETVVHTLGGLNASCVAFCGSCLGIGTIEGDVLVYTLDTMREARRLRGHVRTVQSLRWSHDGRYLLSASRDWTCLLWDLARPSFDGPLRRVKLPGPVWMADLHPTNHCIFAAAVLDAPPVLIDCQGDRSKVNRLSDDPDVDEAGVEESAANRKSRQAVLTCVFVHGGAAVFGGTSKGSLLMWDSTDGVLLGSWRLSSGSIKTMSLCPSTIDDQTTVINSTDRLIRTIRVPNMPHRDKRMTNGEADEGSDELEPLETEHKFQDIVNRQQWHTACFSGNGEYICAGASSGSIGGVSSGQDLFYIWERQRGSLVKILEVPSREEIVDISWHPSQQLPLAAGVGLESGTVHVWGIPAVERWGSFAPDFKELEENVEYVEREDEFDVRPEDELGAKQRFAHEDEFVELESLLPGDESQDFVLSVELLSDQELNVASQH